MTNKLTFQNIAIAGAIVIALSIALFPIAGQPDHFSHSAATVILTLVLWSTGVIPPFLAGLLFFSLATIFNLLPASTLFSGFGSTAVWLVVSGFIIGQAISVSGLGKKLADTISPYLTTSYTRLIAGLVMSAVILGFVMPSSVGRAVVLVPIGMALAEQVGFTRGSNGRLGIATALAVACNMPSFAILPSNIPNMILTGASETLFDIHFGYTEYLLLHFPILGLLKSILLIILVVRIFPAEVLATPHILPQQENVQVEPKIQKRVGILLSCTLLLWVTDSVHGISPAWVGLATAVILLLPKWGVVSPKSFNSSVDFGTVIFVAAALGLGTLVNVSGIGDYVGEGFAYLLPSSQESTFLNFLSLSLISTLTGLITTVPGVPTILSPMAADFAQTTGFSVPAVLMTQVIGFSTVIFPYQVVPLLVAMQLSQERVTELIKIILPLALITIVVLIPLDYFWWSLLGWIK